MVSVIIPIYNVEKYLPTCVNSVLQQTYTDYELILVDDGSLDSCPKLCDNYAKHYDYIQVIHKSNGGLSDARNAGMNVARGKYVTFIDSDDYVHPLYLETLVQAMKYTKADMSLVDFKKVYDLHSIESIDHPLRHMYLCNAIDSLLQVLYQKIHDVSAWGILLPTSLARQYPFPIGKFCEDLYTTYHYYLSCYRVAMVPCPLYYYMQRPGSIMTVKDERFFDMIDASQCLVNACCQNKKLERAALDKQFSNYCNLLLTIPHLENNYPYVYEEIISFVYSHRFSVLLNAHSRMKNKAAAFSLIFGITGLQVSNQFKNVVSSYK